ncbi:MAG: hypothetical protein ABIR71_11630 [Chthoniobacterales bacterium]
MPDPISYPGVYVEEVPVAGHAIAGVATSRTAFLNRTRPGTVNQPIVLASFLAFERLFGGLWELGPLSFAVRDFFLNGGNEAVIVRLYRASSGAGAEAEVAQLAADTLPLEAANPRLSKTSFGRARCKE